MSIKIKNNNNKFHSILRKFLYGYYLLPSFTKRPAENFSCPTNLLPSFPNQSFSPTNISNSFQVCLSIMSNHPRV